MSNDPWGDDLLNVRARGETFTNLIKSIDDSKVISIEAGFGRGKTFFREAWAKHLEAEGEVVIQIDAQKSDHSGDPVVTFIGALMEQLPPKERSAWIKAWGTGKKLLWGGTKIAATVVARKAGEEAMEALEGKLAADGSKSLVDDLVTQFGKDASKSLSAQVTAQLSAERVRQNEMPAQLAELRNALTKDKETNRVVILIDELDRCHPDYVIALLEAMKLVFDQDGYVFCLMVNSDYLQRMAEHRFGKLEDGWEYLEKFVDIRLSLGATDEVISEAARALVLEKLDIVGVPFGEGPEFTVERAAEVAAQLAPLSGLSMRQIKRVLLKVEVALRCYHEVPLDLPLLVWLAFEKPLLANGKLKSDFFKFLPRSNFDGMSFQDSSGELTLNELLPTWKVKDAEGYVAGGQLYNYSGAEGQEPLHGLPIERYFIATESGERKRHRGWAKASMGSLSLAGLSGMAVESLSSYYLPDHREILESTHRMQPTDWE